MSRELHATETVKKGLNYDARASRRGMLTKHLIFPARALFSRGRRRRKRKFIGRR